MLSHGSIALLLCPLAVTQDEVESPVAFAIVVIFESGQPQIFDAILDVVFAERSAGEFHGLILVVGGADFLCEFYFAQVDFDFLLTL